MEGLYIGVFVVVGALSGPGEVGGLVGRGVGSNNECYFDPSSLLTSNSFAASPLLIGHIP